LSVWPLAAVLLLELCVCVAIMYVTLLQCVAVCCSVLQCVAVWCCLVQLCSLSVWLLAAVLLPGLYVCVCVRMGVYLRVCVSERKRERESVCVIVCV